MGNRSQDDALALAVRESRAVKSLAQFLGDGGAEMRRYYPDWS